MLSDRNTMILVGNPSRINDFGWSTYNTSAIDYNYDGYIDNCYGLCQGLNDVDGCEENMNLYDITEIGLDETTWYYSQNQDFDLPAK